MQKLTFLMIIFPLVISQCANQCLTCQLQSNPYACNTCVNNSQMYLWSCSSVEAKTNSLIVITIAITILHLFMLSIGIGIYREIFQSIQLISLISWRYGFQGYSYILQGTNLSLVTNNNFIDIFGIQLIFILILLAGFGITLLMTTHNKTNQNVLLLKRKTIIFPIRIITFVFNILLFSSLVHITTSAALSRIQIWPFIYSILGLACIIGMIIFILVVSNYKKFQVDDPHYYVLVQELINKRWYAKNNLFINLINRLVIILSFIVLFKHPKIAGIVMLASQLTYTIYFLMLIRFRKIRHFACILFGNILTLTIILVIFIGSIDQIGSEVWSSMSTVFQILYYILVGFFFSATLLEIMVNRQKIIKQIKSIYTRFIKCQNDKQIIANKFDQHLKHEKVTQFHTNLLYKKQMPTRYIQMTIINQ